MRRDHHSSDVEPAGCEPIAVPSRRRILGAAGLGAVGLAGAALALDACGTSEPRFARRVITPADQERRGNPGRGDFGTLPITWSVRTSAPVLALTFDDGPDPAFTPRVLDALRRHGARATFFMMGWNCARHPDLARRVLAEGHEIGNHTWTHQDLAHLDPSAALDEIRRGREAIETVTGAEVTLFRPPRGELTGVALRYAAEQRQRILMWTRNGGLRDLTTPDVVAADLVGAVSPGFVGDLQQNLGTSDHSSVSGAQVRA